MKKIIYAIIALFLFIPITVFADSIYSIDMDISLDKNGNADITEIWHTNFKDKTEVYHPYFNLGNSKIEFISVSDSLGNDYTYNNHWNINDSFDKKAKTFGIYKDGSEVDLCWGKTKYGDMIYTVKYRITDFIYNTNDGYQILYWQLIPYNLSSSVDKAYIKIHGPNTYSKDLPVWGYGYSDGYAYVYDGYIEAYKENLRTNEYMTLLVQYPKDTFITSNSISRSFDDVYKQSQEGATKKNKNNFFEILKSFIFYFVFFGMFVLIAIISNIKRSASLLKNKKYPSNDVPTFRDLPCKDDIEEAYFISSEYKLIKKDTDFLGAVLLKWIKNDQISIHEEEGNFKSKKSTLELLKAPTDNDDEIDLYNRLLRVSKDNKLTTDQFERYCSNNYSSIYKWLENVKKNELEELKEKGDVAKIEEKQFFGTSYPIFGATDKLNTKAEQLKGLKIFFKEFSSIHEKEVIEVKMWRDYLIYAQIFGMAKEVAKEFSRIYPNDIDMDMFTTYVLISSFADTGVHAASVAKARAEAYSAGGGGSSFSGGGGGSFGGGGGGGGSR